MTPLGLHLDVVALLGANLRDVCMRGAPVDGVAMGDSSLGLVAALVLVAVTLALSAVGRGLSVVDVDVAAVHAGRSDDFGDELGHLEFDLEFEEIADGVEG